MAPPPSAALVLFHVGRLTRQDFQILRGIIQLIAVLMVDNLTRGKRSTKNLLSDHSMLMATI
jgi:hypothetical protein